MSPNSATVAEFGDKLSPFPATMVAEFGDSATIVAIMDYSISIRDTAIHSCKIGKDVLDLLSKVKCNGTCLVHAAVLSHMPCAVHEH